MTLLPPPLIALVGRPNVGKSTLFNRLTRTRDALVDNTPGLTRDRQYGVIKRGDNPYRLVDTGGYEADPQESIVHLIREQTIVAMEEADLVVFVVDGAAGIAADDLEIAEKLRISGKPVIVAVNKTEKRLDERSAVMFYELGLDPVAPISASQGIGVMDLLDLLEEKLGRIVPPELELDEEGLPKEGLAEEEKTPTRLAIVGCPNAGKSSLINRLLGEHRMLVSEIAGATRDSVDSPPITIGGEEFILVDTAGIRRKARVSLRVEKYAAIAALKAMDRADVAIMLLDAERGITDQDKRIASHAVESGCGLIIVVNKWDLMPRGRDVLKEFRTEIDIEFPRLSHCPIQMISAKSGFGVDKLMPLATKISRAVKMRISTGEFNRWLEGATERNPPPRAGGKPVKMRYGSQVKVSPPTFVIFANRPEKVGDAYKRYLENQLRAAYPLDGAPLRLIFRGGANPYEPEAGKRVKKVNPRSPKPYKKRMKAARAACATGSTCAIPTKKENKRGDIRDWGFAPDPTRASPWTHEGSALDPRGK
ncbi:ribosome biogenesis GTPase Der [Magnetofaba australis]|uniref:GTPase Der n=1 Tax=Magnetofaba australis IT-1 TaxID=1434232 RepID=A0A1Y2K892_9PROT|nr:ribosome biogenesis GTPase Der [Magnetofaba australis]OSM06273.1 putative small GTP-binding protein [Magnetofaba australis IT-1]